jgi:FixJ family two-component response regulator
LKAGAVEFLTKPFRDQDLLDAIQQALERDGKARDQRAALEELRSRFATLTSREREVMKRVVAGLLSKQIAAELGTSETEMLPAGPTLEVLLTEVRRRCGMDQNIDSRPEFVAEFSADARVDLTFEQALVKARAQQFLFRPAIKRAEISAA